MARRIVLDTNVIVAALRSRRGASHRLLWLVGTGRFQTVVSVPLVLEYEAVCRRQAPALGLTFADIDAILDYLCKVSEHRRIHYLWRPALKDPADDMLLELAVEAAADTIVTHNVRDFADARRFGVRAVSPRLFLEEIGDVP